jgi:hypothetical protein
VDSWLELAGCHLISSDNFFFMVHALAEAKAVLWQRKRQRLCLCKGKSRALAKAFLSKRQGFVFPQVKA